MGEAYSTENFLDDPRSYKCIKAEIHFDRSLAVEGSPKLTRKRRRLLYDEENIEPMQSSSGETIRSNYQSFVPLSKLPDDNEQGTAVGSSMDFSCAQQKIESSPADKAQLMLVDADRNSSRPENSRFVFRLANDKRLRWLSTGKILTIEETDEIEIFQDITLKQLLKMHLLFSELRKDFLIELEQFQERLMNKDNDISDINSFVDYQEMFELAELICRTTTTIKITKNQKTLSTFVLAMKMILKTTDAQVQSSGNKKGTQQLIFDLEALSDQKNMDDSETIDFYRKVHAKIPSPLVISRNKRSRKHLLGKDEDRIHWYQDMIYKMNDPILGRKYNNYNNQHHHIKTNEKINQIQKILFRHQPKGLSRKELRSMFNPIEGDTSCLFCQKNFSTLAGLQDHLKTNEHVKMMIEVAKNGSTVGKKQETPKQVSKAQKL